MGFPYFYSDCRKQYIAFRFETLTVWASVSLAAIFNWENTLRNLKFERQEADAAVCRLFCLFSFKYFIFGRRLWIVCCD